MVPYEPKISRRWPACTFLVSFSITILQLCGAGVRLREREMLREELRRRAPFTRSSSSGERERGDSERRRGECESAEGGVLAGVRLRPRNGLRTSVSMANGSWSLGVVTKSRLVYLTCSTDESQKCSSVNATTFWRWPKLLSGTSCNMRSLVIRHQARDQPLAFHFT